MNAKRRSVALLAAATPAESYFETPIRRIRAAAAAVAARRHWDVLMIVRRGSGIDDTEFASGLPAPIRSLRLVRTVEELDAAEGPFDLCVVCVRVVDEELLIKQVRERALAPLIVMWGWDNHHSRKRNLQISQLADLILPAHGYCAAYLLSPHTVMGGLVPLGSYQWSRATASALFARHRDRPRDNAIHGGFVSWRIAPERAAFVKRLCAGMRGHALRLVPGEGRMRYFERDPEERWLDWAAHKVGLILPFHKDLSTRFFDSLLTGQVPVVPEWCKDFDKIVGKAAATSLPVVRLAEETVPAVKAAWREAVERYDTDGAAGAERRHRYALENHHLVHRLAPLCAEIRALAAPDAVIETATGMGAVGSVLRRP